MHRMPQRWADDYSPDVLITGKWKNIRLFKGPYDWLRKSGPTRETVAVDAELKRPASVFAGLSGLQVRLSAQDPRIPSYEVVDREKNDRADHRADKACRLTRAIQT